MAMSFSRPDPASPAQVADATFSTGRRGYDQDEVRDFLRMVSAELGRLRERELFLERELRSMQAHPDLGAAHLDDAELTRLVGEETARVLNAARESANEIREKAEQSAARILSEASEEAARRREETEIEASRRRTDAANDAEAELSMAKQQGREMVNEARAYRERVLSELARRRELAREQIEQLIHGRDRLMQSFERARLVAVDVVAEMQPLGEPDEYVNLQPTTGPVPVMVARTDEQETAEEQAAEVEAEEAEQEAVEAEEAEAEEAEAEEEEAEDTEAEAADDATDDDVVVDLFARLRDAEQPEEASEASEPSEASEFEQRDADLTPLIVASAKKLKRVLADEQNEVLDALRRGDAVSELDEIVPTGDAHVARYTDAIRDDLLLAANAGAQIVSPDRTAKLTKSAGKVAVDHAASMVGEWLVSPLRDRLDRSISDGAGDNPTITKTVRAVYREWKTQHIDEQLDDILRAAHGRGLLAGLDSEAPVRWVGDPRFTCCADCDDNGLEGVVAAGEPFPTGHAFAPAHPGCRCMLLPDAP